MKIISRFSSIVVAASLALGSFHFIPKAYAGPEICKVLSQLEGQTERPTVETIVAAFQKVGANPLSESFANDLRTSCGSQYARPTSKHDLVNTKLPKIIAQFEWAFPGAIYAGMGRDSSFLVDLMDGFYLGRLGLANRAKHFRLSGTSFTGQTEYLIPEYISSLGFDWKSTPPPRAFVLFDATRYIGVSQSARTLKSLYAYAVKHWSGDARQAALLQKLPHIINLVSASRRNNDNPISNNVAKDLDALSDEVARNNGTIPSRVLTVEGENLTYSLEWHGKFGALQKTADGSVTHSILTPTGNGVRREILIDTLAGLRLVNSQSFFDAVVNEAERLGYDFVAYVGSQSANSSTPQQVLSEEEKQDLQKLREKRHEEQFNEIMASLRAIRPKLKNAEELERIEIQGANEKMTANAAEYHKWLVTLSTFFRTRPVQSELAITKEERLKIVDEFLAEITRANETLQLTNRDLRRLIPELVKHLRTELIKPGDMRKAVVDVFHRALQKHKHLALAFSAEMEDWETFALKNIRHQSLPIGFTNAFGGLDRWNPGVFGASEVRYFLVAVALDAGIKPKVRQKESVAGSKNVKCARAWDQFDFRSK